LFPLVATGVIETGGKFAAGVVDTGGKLPPVSLMPAANTGGKFAADVVDTGGKFATGINNTSGTGRKVCRRCR
jgi:hypothetical protein